MGGGVPTSSKIPLQHVETTLVSGSPVSRNSRNPPSPWSPGPWILQVLTASARSGECARATGTCDDAAWDPNGMGWNWDLNLKRYLDLKRT